jgi:hypothetical protein
MFIGWDRTPHSAVMLVYNPRDVGNVASLENTTQVVTFLLNLHTHQRRKFSDIDIKHIRLWKTIVSSSSSSYPSPSDHELRPINDLFRSHDSFRLVVS